MTTRDPARSSFVGAIVAAATTLALVVPAHAGAARIGQTKAGLDDAGVPPSGSDDPGAMNCRCLLFHLGARAARNMPRSVRSAGTAAGWPIDLAVRGATSAAVIAFHVTAARVTDDATASPDDTDWSSAVVASAMARQTPSEFGEWLYSRALTLWGFYLNYQRTHDPRILPYIRAWADRFVRPDGSIDQSFDSLDSMQGGNILLLLYRETGATKYRTAAQKIRDRLATYPRTRDGGWWHRASADFRNQLWADGVFMVLPQLVRHGRWIGDEQYAHDEATRQLTLYFEHLRDDAKGLLRHAWAQDPDDPAASWADERTGQAPLSWCRAAGWFGMATIEVLEHLPADHPQRQSLVDIVAFLAAGWVRWQDPVTGRWFQVVDRGDRPDNWTETSCSAMYTYVLSRGVERGWIPATPYLHAATRGRAGVLAKVTRGRDGCVDIADISVGTDVGDYDYYIRRPRVTNDKHGLGAFLIMAEQMQRTSEPTRSTPRCSSCGRP